MYKKLFATEIFVGPLGVKKQFLSELATDCRNYKKIDSQGLQWSEKNYPNGYTSYGSLDQIYKLSSNFKMLQKLIDKKVYVYAKKLGLKIPPKELKMISFWINIMGPNAIHTGHIHPLSVISGTFYVHTPRGASPLKFEDPRLGFMMNTPPRDNSFYSAKVKSGDLVLFESWARHEVPINRTQEDRISLSFNYDWVKN